MTQAPSAPTAVTPAVGRLRWLLDAVADPRLATVDALAERLSPRAAAATTAADFAAALQELATELAGATVDRLEATGEGEAVARIATPAGGGWLLRCTVDPEPPHGIVTTELLPARTPTSGGCSAPVPWDRVAAHEPVGDGLPDGVVAALDELRTALRLPGLLAAVVRDGALAGWAGLGYAEVATRRRPARRTALRLGTTSTVLTALAVHRLAAEGRLGLDDPAEEHLAGLRITPPAGCAEPVRVRHLLTHTAGLTADPRRPVGVPAGVPVPELAELYRPGIAAAMPPGRTLLHSYDGYALLGQLVADVTGMSFEQYAATHVLDPLGMRHSSYLLDDRVARQPMCGYEVDFDEVAVAPGSDVVLRPAAGAVSTLDDLVRLAGALVDPVLAAGAVPIEAHRLLVAPAAADGPLAAVTAAGLSCGVLGDTPVVWICGGWPGALTGLWVAPSAGIAVVVAANAFSAARLGAVQQAGARLVELATGE